MRSPPAKMLLTVGRRVEQIREPWGRFSESHTRKPGSHALDLTLAHLLLGLRIKVWNSIFDSGLSLVFLLLLFLFALLSRDSDPALGVVVPLLARQELDATVDLRSSFLLSLNEVQSDVLPHLRIQLDVVFWSQPECKDSELYVGVIEAVPPNRSVTPLPRAIA